jgi:hypothetical protein
MNFRFLLQWPILPPPEILICLLESLGVMSVIKGRTAVVIWEQKTELQVKLSYDALRSCMSVKPGLSEWENIINWIAREQGVERSMWN